MTLCTRAAADYHPDSYMDYVQGAHIWVLCNKDHMAPHGKKEYNMLLFLFHFSSTPPPQQYYESSYICYSSLSQRMNDVCVALKEFLFELLFEFLHKGHASLHGKQKSWSLWTYFRVSSLKVGIDIYYIFTASRNKAEALGKSPLRIATMEKQRSHIKLSWHVLLFYYYFLKFSILFTYSKEKN